MDELNELMKFLQENLLLGDSTEGIILRSILVIVLAIYWGILPI